MARGDDKKPVPPPPPSDEPKYETITHGADGETFERKVIRQPKEER